MATPQPRRAPSHAFSRDELVHEAEMLHLPGVAIGIVGVNSKLHQIHENVRRDKVRWNPLDWLLGTKRGQFCLLACVAVFLIIAGALAWLTTGGNESYSADFWQALWFSWGMFFDPGTQTSFKADDPMKFKAPAVAFSILGFTYNLVMLGIIVDLVRNILEHFHKKRSRIVANGHTLLLGWTEKSLYAMQELMSSAENQGLNLEIVVLAEQDSIELWQEICRHFPDPSVQRRISIRNGNPCECEDLTRASAVSAREIIILGGSGPPEIVDLDTERTIVALAALEQPPSGNIIAEVRTPEMCSAISELLDNAEGIFARNAIKRVLCLMAVRPVVGDTFKHLMSWSSGAEIYCKELKDLGVAFAETFAQARNLITGGIVIGVRPEDQHSIMSPPDEYALKATDRLLVLAESQLDICPEAYTVALFRRSLGSRRMSMASSGRRMSMGSGEQGIAPETFLTFRTPEALKEQVVIIVGWPTDIDDLLTAMADYISPGSRVIIMAEVSLEKRAEALNANMDFKTPNFEIKHMVGSTTSIHSLRRLPLDTACAVLVLSDSAYAEDPKMSDSACLATMITIDALLKGQHPQFYQPSGPAPRLICEVLSAVMDRALPENHKLRQAATFFESNALETGLFTIASSQTPVYNALLLLLQPNDFGSIDVVHLQDYYSQDEISGSDVSFTDCFERVRAKDDVLLGTFNKLSGIVTINTPKTGTISPLDQLIVLSRSESKVNNMGLVVEAEAMQVNLS